MQPAENSSNGGKTETTNVKKNLHTTADLDCQICHEKSLKPENVSAREDETGHVVQGGRDLPLTTDGAWKNTSSMSDANPGFTKIPLEGTDKGALYGKMNGRTLVGLS